jgi:hypothetical protein
MTVLGGGDFSIPLYTYEISLGTKRDYQGPLLSQLLEGLAQKVKSVLENTSFDSSAIFNDIMNVILPPAQDVIGEHCPKKEFSIRVGEILTTEPSDWKTP